jgi:hypothetical protein
MPTLVVGLDVGLSPHRGRPGFRALLSELLITQASNAPALRVRSEAYRGALDAPSGPD